MSSKPRQIIALGGGGFMMESSGLLDEYVLSASAADSPSICFLGTASGDAESAIVRFYRAFNPRPCRPTHLELFRRDSTDLADYFASRDIIYVGGGNTANMLAIWRLHGVDQILADCWRAGVVLAGLSAGSVCWFECGVTDSFGSRLAPLEGGLGLIAGSHCPHYDGEAERRPAYHALLASGALPSGLAADDGVALHFRDSDLDAVVSSREGAAAYRVTVESGAVREEVIPATFLGRA